MTTPPIEDIVRALGHLTLGTRLKRLGERLQLQTQALLDAEGLDLPASHFPVLAALDRLGAASVGELAAALGSSQPGVTRMLKLLQGASLVQAGPAAEDRRVRRVVLSRRGQQMVRRARAQAWPRVASAVADACASTQGSLLQQLAGLEDALLSAPLLLRSERLRAEGT